MRFDMNGITTGKMLKNAREMLELSVTQLVEGVCSRRTLQKLEDDETECDLLLFIVLLQRLGKSPDKLEYILSRQEYRLERMRNWFLTCVFKGNQKWAERALDLYWKKAHGLGTVHRMYLCRGRAMISYWIEHDLEEAEGWLIQTLDSTFPRWKEDEWTNCRISTLELENILSLVRVQREQHKPVWDLLQRCGRYINFHVTDGEEHAKIFSKYAWLAAQEKLEHNCPEDAITLCTEALRVLRKYSIEYFLRPLLTIILQCYQKIEKKKNRLPQSKTWISKGHCRVYLSILEKLNQYYGRNWYPQNSIFCNCTQKSYHLDYEIVRGERYIQGMTQEMVADGIYRNAKEIGRIERGQIAPKNKHFIKIMEKFGFHKERRSGFVVADSFQTLELRKQIQGCISRHQYDIVQELVIKLKQQLDMNIFENSRTVQMIWNFVNMYKGLYSYQELLQKSWKLLRKTYHFLPDYITKWIEKILYKEPRENSVEYFRGKKKQYRVPLKNETDMINQVAILLKKIGKGEEAIQLYSYTIHLFNQSDIKEEYRYRSYGLLLGNMAADKCSINDSIEVLNYSLRCGKLGALGRNYLTIACALEDDSSNQKICCQMIIMSYFLFELSNNNKNQTIVKKYYMKNYSKINKY